MANAEQTLEKPQGLDDATIDAITRQCVQQLQTSRQFKRERLAEIKENEDLYYGITQKTIRNPFNECFPFMAGFVDHMRAKIEDDSSLLFGHDAEADLKRAAKTNAFYEMESKSQMPGASWDVKHRYAKFNALLSGLAVYKYYAESVPDYRSCLEVVSHYDFHFEPRGGGIIENHLFCGQDNIYKNKEDIVGNKYYIQDRVAKIVSQYVEYRYKDNNDWDGIRNNRFEAMKQDPNFNNFVGQDTIKFAEWYTTYKNKRYYVLFNEKTIQPIRCCLLTELFPDDLYPYAIWHTNEDPDLMLSKAPADDARPVAKIINTMINQELYNRQKRNYGQRAYDAEMFPNVQALADWRPDGLIPVDTKGGGRRISEGVFEFKVGDLSGTLDLVTWLESFTGKQVGYTSSGAGQSENDKKVGVFQGEIQQVEQLIGVKNKSYRNCLTRIGLLFKQGADHNLKKDVAIKLMGAKGVEWDTFGPDDLKTERNLTIQPVGGTSEIALKRLQDNEKIAMLTSPILTSVNPQWRDREILLLKGYTEEDVKDAFSSDTFAQKEILSEAAQAEKDIVEGKTPGLNRGADANFMQHIVDFATDTEDLSDETYKKLMDYAMAHTEIALENGARNIKEMLRKKTMAQFSAPTPPVPPAKPTAPAPTLSTVNPTPTPVV